MMILKNIKHLVRQYPLSLMLNFIGLTCAFTAFLVISHQVEYELTFDTCHPTASRVFRADKIDDETMFRNILPRGFSDDIIASSPHIVAGCSYFPFYEDGRFTTIGDNPEGFTKKAQYVTPGFIKVFGIEMVEGDIDALNQPSTVIIPQSLANVLYPGKSALGQMIHAESDIGLEETNGNATVTGVYRDFPSNTQFDNALFVSALHMQEGQYGGANFICYVLLDDPANRKAVEDNFNTTYDFSRFDNWLTPIQLTKFTDIYFLNEGNIYKSGSYSQLLLLIAIAILILLTGMINFTNFYIALTPMRMRSVNTRMVFGASKLALRSEVIGESLVWSLLSFFFAIILFNPVCSALSINGLIPDTFNIGSQPALLIIAILATVLTGIAAGILPGIYSTSIQPALALKGSFGLSKSGRMMRTTLVYVQLIVSFVLLIYVLSIEHQSQFMKNFPCGFDKNNLMVINVGDKNSVEHKDWLKERFGAIPGVEGVSFASQPIGTMDSYNTYSFDFGQGYQMTSLIYCASDFPKLIGLEVRDGANYTPAHGDYLLTENFINQGAEIRNYEDDLNVKGFVNNVNITSLRKSESYVAFLLIGDNYQWALPHVYIRFADNADRIVLNDAVRNVLHEMDPLHTYELIDYGSMAGTLYSGEERLRKEIWLFSMLAIILSLVGIWGQTLMDVRYRRKEISVKRVLGASATKVIGEGLRHYSLMVGICFVIASPFAYLVSERYMSQFAYRAGISPIAFIVSLVAVLALTVVVVAYHYTMSLRINPAEVLKHE